MSSHSEPTLSLQTPKGGRGGSRNRPKNISANVIINNNNSTPVRSNAVNVPHHAQSPLKHNHHHHQKPSKDIVGVPAPQRAPKDFITPPHSPVERNHHQGQKENRKPRRRNNNNSNKGKVREVNGEIQSEIKETVVNQGYESPSSSSNEESGRGPHTPGFGTPGKAYAGPNFHSSPNPNSLPMPSWFATKAMPVTPTAGSNLQAMLDMSGQETMSKSLENNITLDKLFQAHKQEQARISSTQASQPPSPVSARLSPVNQETSFNDVFTMELDGRKASPKPVAIPSTPPAVEKKLAAMPPSPASSVKKPASDVKTQAALKSFLSNPFAIAKPLAVESKDAKPTRPSAPVHTKSASATLITTPPRNNYKRNNYHQQQQGQISLVTSTGSPALRRFNNPYQQSHQQPPSARVQTAINLFPSAPPAVASPSQSSTGLEDHLRAALRLSTPVQVQTAAAS